MLIEARRVLYTAKILGAVLLSAVGVRTAWPCTTFVLTDGSKIYYGGNLDWPWERGLIIINPRDIQKTSLPEPGAVPAKWISRYGSITFNQFGQEMPYSGMNEAGLVVECSSLDEAQYAPADLRPTISPLQWIQYQLDNCRTVEEVLATDAKLRLYTPTAAARVHYLVCDIQGECATIEILGGKMVSHRAGDLPFRALANDSYQRSVEYARAHLSDENVWDRSSLVRFARASLRAKQFKSSGTAADLQYASDVLEEVSQGSTVWSFVYDIPALQIHYFTRSNPQRRSIKLKDLDFSSDRPVQFADIRDNPAPDGKCKFQNLSESEHRRYLERFVTEPSVKQRFGDLMPQLERLLTTLRGFHPTNSTATPSSAQSPVHR